MKKFLPILVSGMIGFALISTGCGGGGGGGTTASQVTFTVATGGTRGEVPITIQVGGNASKLSALGTGGTSVAAGNTTTVTLTAPSGYGDRQFSGWVQGANTLSNNPVFTFTPSAIPGGITGTTIAASYVGRAIPTGGFSPNFSSAEYKHWQFFPIRVFLDPTVTANAVTQQAILSGLNQWPTATGGVLSYQTVSTSNQADVTIALGTATETSGASGVTDSRWNRDDSLVSAAITLNLSATAQRSPQIIQTIAAHEFGHALGLTGTSVGIGHSADPNDTMYPVPSALNQNLSERDINTIENVYPSLFNGG